MVAVLEVSRAQMSPLMLLRGGASASGAAALALSMMQARCHCHNARRIHGWQYRTGCCRFTAHLGSGSTAEAGVGLGLLAGVVRGLDRT